MSSTTAPTRRSSRKKVKYSCDSDPDDTNYYEEMDAKLQKKKSQKPKKTGTVKGTGRRGGRLASMSDMPLDILFEIFGHLHPYDLLKLSRTTKDYRRLLLDRHSITLWKDACQNIEGMPEPFEGVCLPAWVNLLYYAHCHFCARVAHTIDWVLKLRICSHCAPERLGKTSSWCFMPPDTMSFSLRAIHDRMIPSRLSNNGRDTFYLQTELDSLHAEYEALKTAEARDQLVAERKAKVEDHMKHVGVCQAWEKKQVSHREVELQMLRNERLSSIKAKLVELGWKDDLNAIRFPDSLARHKLVNKPQKLTPRIWSNIQGELILYMESMREKRLDRERAALIMKRKSILADIWRSYQLSHIHDRQPLPNPVEVCSFQPVADLINQANEIEVTAASFQSLIHQLDDYVLEWRESLNPALYRHLKESKRIPFAWANGIWDDDDEIGDFSPLLRRRDSRDEPSPFVDLSNEEVESRIKLAKTVFSCNKCRASQMYEEFSWFAGYGAVRAPAKCSPMFYPHILGHRCCDSKFRLSFEEDDEEMDDSDEDHYMAFVSSPQKFLPLLQAWSPDCLTFDVEMSNLASVILSAVDTIDSNSVTVEEMDTLNMRFTCLQLQCVTDESDSDESPSPHAQPTVSCSSPMFDWRGVIQHQMNKHDGVVTGIKEKYAVELHSALATSIQDQERRHIEEQTNAWICMHCDKSKSINYSGLVLVKRHLSIKHGLGMRSITEDQDYTRAYDWPNTRPSSAFFRPVRMTPEGPILQ